MLALGKPRLLNSKLKLACTALRVQRCAEATCFWRFVAEPADPQETTALESQVAAVCASAMRFAGAFLCASTQVLFRLGEVSWLAQVAAVGS